MKKLLFFLMAAIFAIQGWSQTTLTEGFESTTFPPDDWMIVNTLGPSTQWTRSTSYSHSGSASAFITYNSSGSINYMITPKLVINSTNDSISFWARMDVFSSSFDQTFLKILVSTTDNNVTSFDTTTLLHISPSFTSTPNNQITDVWKKWTISLSAYMGQEIFIAFRQYDDNGYGLCIDDVSGPTLYVPSCPKPKNLTSTNITTTSMDIGWTPGSPTDIAWYIYYRLAGAGSWDSISTSTNPATISNLSPSSKYEVRMRTICGADMSDLSSIGLFNTSCGTISSLPWSDNFDTYGTGTSATFPLCWSKNSSNTTYPYVSSTNFSSPGSLYFYTSTAGGYNIALLPPFDNTIPVNTLRLKFKYRTSYLTDTLKIGVMSDTSLSSWTQVAFVTAPSTYTWIDCEIPLNSYQGTGQYIALRQDYGYSYNYGYVDNLEVSYIPSCAKPTNINFTNLTTNSVDIAWTPGNSTDYAWWVYYRVAGTTAWDSSYATLNPHSLSNLNTSTGYEIEIRTDCGTALSEASFPAYFQTLCVSIDGLTGLPWNEGFEGITANNDLPACWSATNLGNYTYTQIADYNSYNRNARTGTKSAYFRYGCNDNFTTPVFDLYAGQTYAFSFWYITDGYSGWQNLQARVKSSSDTSVNQIIGAPLTNVTNTSYQVYIGTFTPSANGTYEFSIECLANGVPYYLTIDDIRLEVSNCGMPTNVAFANLTATSVDLTWDMGNNSQWVVGYKLASDTVWTDNTAITNSYSFTNLPPSTSYDFRVASVCGIDTSMFIILNQATLCVSIDGLTGLPWNEGFEGITANNDLPACWSATNLGSATYTQIADYNSYNRNARTGTKSAYFDWGCNDSFTTPVFDLYAGQTYAFSFWYVTDGYSGWQNLQARVKSSSDTSVNQIIGAPLTNVTNTSYQVYIGTFTPSANGTYEFSIECLADGNPWYLTIDDIRLEVSNCGMPTNVAFANLTTTSVDLTWDMGNNSQWVVGYKLASDTVWTNNTTITNSYTFTNLTSSTSYDFRVAAVCGVDTSMFITKSIFTPCVPVTSLPYTENFDTYGTTTGTFPPCWSRPIINSGYPSLYSYTNYSAPASIMFQSQTTQPTYAISPQLASDINALRVRFMLRAESLTSSGTITVGVLSSNIDTSSFVAIQTIQPTNTNFNLYEISFAASTLTGPNNFIAFRHNSNSDYWYYWLDDVIIDSIPSCPKPISLNVSNITTTTADINWVSGGNNTTNWWLYWKASSATSYDSVYVTNVLTHTLNNLNSNTVYNYYMRTDCSTEISEPTSVYSFRTACGIITSVPWTDYFDSYGTGSTIFPPCWTRNTTYTDRPYVSSTNFTAPGSLYFYAGTSGTYNIAATPQFDVTIPINTLQASFMLRKSNSTDSITIGVMTDPTQASTFVPVSTIAPTTTSAWQPFDVSFASYTGTGTYIAFKIQYNTTYCYMYMDNLEIYTIPTCTRPNAPTASNPTNTSIDVSWTDPNVNNTLYKVYYRMLGDTTWSVINNATSPTTITGLSGSTTYQVAISTDCSTEESILTTPVLMQTACGPMNIPTYKEQFLTMLPNSCWARFTGQLPSTGNANLATSTSGWSFNSNLTPNNARVNLYSTNQFYWLVTPSVDLAGGAASNRLEFDVFFTGYANANPPSGTNSSKRFVVLISTDNGATWSSTNILKKWDNAGSVDTLNSLTNVVKNISIPIVDSNNTPYSGIVKFAFYGESVLGSEGDNDLHIDNFQVVGQGCDAPTNILANNITSISADISWNPGSTETAWQIRQGTAGTPIDVTTTSYQATGLTPNTSYTYYIRSNCGISYSGWVPVTFTTNNMPTNPVVTTSPVTAYTHNTATLTGSFIEGTNSVTAIGFDFKLASASTWTNTPITPLVNPFNYSATGLIPNTAYKVRAYATTSAGTFYGDSVNFTTDPLLPPTVTTDTVLVDNPNKSAIFQGTTSQGTNSIIARGFEYKISGSNWSTAIDLTATGSANITATATGLSVNTYQVRAYAETLEGGKTYGGVKSFVITSGIEGVDVDNLDVNLYPNPASSEATLSIKGINGKVKISITDVQGRTISTLERESTNGEVKHSINLEAYAKGVYYIRIQSNNSIKTQKLIVQ